MDNSYYLECCIAGSDIPQRILLNTLPITIGRGSDCSVIINTSALSRRHACIEYNHSEIILRDLNSTNGCFINHQRIAGHSAIKPGDVVHFGDIEYCLKDDQDIVDDDERTRIQMQTLPKHFSLKRKELSELIDQQLVTTFQQVITLGNGDVYGHELLGRGEHPTLGSSPFELFQIAQSLNKHVELSRLFRQRGFAQAELAGMNKPLFFNSHPEECHNPDMLLLELTRLRKLHPGLQLMFEVHEAAVTDIGAMTEIRNELNALDIGLAYDDFGSGQARLRELAEAPPDIVKFDISLVRGVGDPQSPRYKLLLSLNKLVQEMGIATLAEGVESEDDALACKEIGVNYFQGYFYGRPAPIH
ncbi:putative signaling protein [Zhongshania aliphaticivorans]|uniref:Putative signaling protein n=1 Tax=Zhongshania aliphaticivorans TaxID=1470434 RepID=A0A5S9NR08_9GAMM|nr:EAL domain-containing protein [Zhongshania aliphaticivorans]CAA0092836.1 putative signaling protein [Zhongshania aliphaticivorans]CAA0110384.1 putative signaling protein [Zhongshania aliphaticivorans]